MIIYLILFLKLHVINDNLKNLVKINFFDIFLNLFILIVFFHKKQETLKNQLLLNEKSTMKYYQ